jgi:hypothetical protein
MTVGDSFHQMLTVMDDDGTLDEPLFLLIQ